MEIENYCSFCNKRVDLDEEHSMACIECDTCLCDSCSDFDGLCPDCVEEWAIDSGGEE